MAAASANGGVKLFGLRDDWLAGFRDGGSAAAAKAAVA